MKTKLLHMPFDCGARRRVERYFASYVSVAHLGPKRFYGRKWPSNARIVAIPQLTNLNEEDLVQVECALQAEGFDEEQAS
jgi:hypothetical protein